MFIVWVSYNFSLYRREGVVKDTHTKGGRGDKAGSPSLCVWHIAFVKYLAFGNTYEVAIHKTYIRVCNI